MGQWPVSCNTSQQCIPRRKSNSHHAFVFGNHQTPLAPPQQSSKGGSPVYLPPSLLFSTFHLSPRQPRWDRLSPGCLPEPQWVPGFPPASPGTSLLVQIVNALFPLQTILSFGNAQRQGTPGGTSSISHCARHREGARGCS